jgi:anti-sigma B factor antagonist
MPTIAEEYSDMDRDFVPRLRIEQVPSREGLALVVTGDLDAANSHILREALVDAIDNRGGLIVVDMTSVNYIDSIGLGTLVSGLKRGTEAGAHLRFVITNPQIQKVLNITGLVRLLEIYDTREKAFQV